MAGRLPSLLVVLGAVLALSPGPSARAQTRDALWVTSIAVPADYAASGVVLASATRIGCTTDCAVLRRTGDRGATWSDATTAGWAGGPLEAAPLVGRRAVVSVAAGRTQVSDDGARFRDVARAGGAVVTFGRRGGDVAVGVSGGSRPAVVDLSSGAVTPVPETTVARPTVHFSPAYPAATAVAPAVLVAGQDPVSKMPAVARCDAAFRCERPVVLPHPREDLALLHPSPRFDRDGVALAQTTFGRLYRTGDGGRTFQPLVVAPVSPDDVANAVQAVAFSPDFDGRAQRGRILVGVVVAQSVDHRPSLSGGLYASADAGRTWRAAGAPIAGGGVTAVAVAPDGRAFAGHFSDGGGAGGLLCSTDWETWAATCPAAPQADTEPAATSPALTTGRPDPPAAKAPAARPGSAPSVAGAPEETGRSAARPARTSTALVLVAVVALAVLGASTRAVTTARRAGRTAGPRRAGSPRSRT
jgi:hypothetical protein